MSAAFPKGRAAGFDANLTPMIDVVFLLIVFFVLVSQIVEIENVEMELPDPTNPRTMLMPDDQRLILNVVPSKDHIGEIESYQIGTRRFTDTPEGVEEMVAHLATLYERNRDININLRADQSTHYEWVEPAMHAITLAARRIDDPALEPSVNLVVVPQGGRRP